MTAVFHVIRLARLQTDWDVVGGQALTKGGLRHQPKGIKHHPKGDKASANGGTRHDCSVTTVDAGLHRTGGDSHVLCAPAKRRTAELSSSPSHIVKINLRMVSESSFERASTIVMLDTVGIEALYLAIVLGDNKLYKHSPLWSKEQPLKLLWVLEFLQCLQTASESTALTAVSTRAV